MLEGQDGNNFKPKDTIMREGRITQITIPLFDMDDFTFEDEISVIANDLNMLESEILYFSAGKSQIKEILIKQDPSFSV